MTKSEERRSAQARDAVSGGAAGGSAVGAQRGGGAGRQRPTRVRAAARAARLLLLVAEAGDEGLGATAAATRLGMAVPTTYHLLNTLADEGLLAKDARKRFVLGPLAAIVADAHARRHTVPDYLLAPLHALADETAETAYLVAWRGEDIVVLAGREGEQAVRVAEVERGPYRDAHARAGGKALLAFAPPDLRERYLANHPPRALTKATLADPQALTAELEAIRAAGVAVDREEFVEEVSCAAAPIMAGHALVGAYSISAPSRRFEARADELRDAVRRAALDAIPATPFADAELEAAS
jgi:IclR family acetate operon transcriptional repressor